MKNRIGVGGGKQSFHHSNMENVALSLEGQPVVWLLFTTVFGLSDMDTKFSQCTKTVSITEGQVNIKQIY